MEQNRNKKNDRNRQIGVAQACAAFPFPARSGNEEIGSDHIMQAPPSGGHLFKDTHNGNEMFFNEIKSGKKAFKNNVFQKGKRDKT